MDPVHPRLPLSLPLGFAFVPTPELVSELIGVVGEARMRWPQVLIHNMF
ncbi:MAG: hypothetical protein ACI9U2_000662 [Bradymonadia bacterium]|jgi:hypothetical protein